MRAKHNVTELPIGAVKGARGLVTLTGGWIDQYTRTVTDADKDKYTKRLLVLTIDNLRPVTPDNDEGKEYWILCTRLVFKRTFCFAEQFGHFEAELFCSAEPNIYLKSSALAEHPKILYF